MSSRADFEEMLRRMSKSDLLSFARDELVESGVVRAHRAILRALIPHGLVRREGQGARTVYELTDVGKAWLSEGEDE